MAMTRKEAIEELERLLSHWDDLEKGKRRFRWYSKAALDVALSALRPVTREQVEKLWPGCGLCEDAKYVSGSASAFKSYDGQYEIETYVDGDFDFCPGCGRPMTAEAVELVLKRLEKLYETE